MGNEADRINNPVISASGPVRLRDRFKKYILKRFDQITTPHIPEEDDTAELARRRLIINGIVSAGELLSMIPGIGLPGEAGSIAADTAKTLVHLNYWLNTHFPSIPEFIPRWLNISPYSSVKYALLTEGFEAVNFPTHLLFEGGKTLIIDFIRLNGKGHPFYDPNSDIKPNDFPIQPPSADARR